MKEQREFANAKDFTALDSRTNQSEIWPSVYLPKSSGFSAIEILVVVAIASILVVMMVGYSPQAVVQTTDVASRVQSFLLQARLDAKSNSKCLQLTVDSAQKKILRQYYDLPSDCVAPLSAASGAQQELSLQEAESIAAFLPDASLVFNRLGALSNAQKQELTYTLNGQNKKIVVYPLSGQILSEVL